jgi:uncharacterized protein involved in response to NO
LFKKICEEPYRLFFPLGVLAGIFGVSHWLLYALGFLREYSAVFHSSIQTQLYVSLFIFGFLMTAGPRFAGAPHATAKEVVVFVILFLSMFICLIFYNWLLSEILFIISLLMLGLFLFQRMLKKGVYKPPAEFVWIPIGILCGVIGSMLSIAGRTSLLPSVALAVGKPMKEQGFILSVVMGVGGFLGPRLMGFLGLMQPSELRSMAEAQKKRLQRMRIHFFAGIMLFTSFWLEGKGWIVPAYGLRALIVTLELLWTTAIYRIPTARELFARLLWFALWMVIVGYWGVALWPMQRKTMLHLVFIGGFSVMIFAVATMVVLSHAGEGERLKKPLWALRFAAAGVILALLFRFIASFFPVHYFGWLAVAAVCWASAGFCWLWFVVPRLMRCKSTESESC